MWHHIFPGVGTAHLILRLAPLASHTLAANGGGPEQTGGMQLDSELYRFSLLREMLVVFLHEMLCLPCLTVWQQDLQTSTLNTTSISMLPWYV